MHKTRKRSSAIAEKAHDARCYLQMCSVHTLHVKISPVFLWRPCKQTIKDTKTILLNSLF